MEWFKKKKTKDEPIADGGSSTTEIAVIIPKPKKKVKKKPSISNKKLEKTLYEFHSLIEETSRKFSSQLDTATRHYKYLGAAIEHLEKQYKGLYEIIRQNQIGVQNVYDKINVIINVPKYQTRINKALKLMVDHTYLTEVDHKDWLIDQVAHQLLEEEYDMWAEKRHCRPAWKTGTKPPAQIERLIEGETESQKRLRKLIEDAEK